MIWSVSGTAFPRLKTTVILIDTIRTQPKLAKESSSALIGLGDSLCQTATTEETQALIQGTLAQESHVRNSCLQTLQVRIFSFLSIMFFTDISCSRLTSRKWTGSRSFGLPVMMTMNRIPALQGTSGKIMAWMYRRISSMTFFRSWVCPSTFPFFLDVADRT